MLRTMRRLKRSRPFLHSEGLLRGYGFYPVAADIPKKEAGLTPVRMTRPCLKPRPSDYDLNVRFATDWTSRKF